MKDNHYYYRLLNTKEKEAYVNILNAARHFKKEAVLPCLDTDSLQKVWYSIIYDEPKLFFIYRYNGYNTTNYADKTLLTINPSMEMSAALEYYARIAERMKPVLRNISGRSQFDQALYLHDYLQYNVKYGSPDTYPEAPFNILGAFLCNECVCAGFSTAYKFLMDKLGIMAMIACGDVTTALHENLGYHAWNIIWLGGKPYHVDVTFDILMADKFCSRAYFLLSDKEIGFDHFPDKKHKLPSCPESACPLKLVTGTYDLMKYLKTEAARGADHTEVRLSKGFQSDELINDVINGWFQRTNRSYFARRPYYYYSNMKKTLFIEWKDT